MEFVNGFIEVWSLLGLSWHDIGRGAGIMSVVTLFCIMTYVALIVVRGASFGRWPARWRK